MVGRVRDRAEARDRLLRDVSHELRSPITRLKVALELPPDDAQRRRMSADVTEMETKVTELLELERGALRSLTSCAWFFDDIGGIEPLQVLRYAARVVALAGADGPRLEEGFTHRLAAAESKARTRGSGREIYLQRARPPLPPPLQVGAGLAAARQLAPAAATSPAWRLEGPDEQLTLPDRRTGREHRMAA